MSESYIRSIIMDYYDNPKYRTNELNVGSKYLYYHSKSDSCMDSITLYLKINDDEIIEDGKYIGTGCAISISSSEILLSKIIDLKISDAEKIINLYHNLLLSGESNVDTPDVIQELYIFKNIYKHPNRILCARITSYAALKIFAQYKNLNKGG
ncbi:MAG: iron-sulfur cluster assembly scaffold protein [Mycoplasmoidaceae bacterium]